MANVWSMRDESTAPICDNPLSLRTKNAALEMRYILTIFKASGLRVHSSTPVYTDRAMSARLMVTRARVVYVLHQVCKDTKGSEERYSDSEQHQPTIDIWSPSYSEFEFRGSWGDSR